MEALSEPVLTETRLPGFARFKSGKVREIVRLKNAYLLVATDRISAFDGVLPTGIPDKGRVLNQLSAWWFDRTRDLVPNHLITASFQDFPDELQAYRSRLDGRSMLVRKAEAIPVECVVRDYLESIGWNKSPPAPVLPSDIVGQTPNKYREAFTLITGKELNP